MMSRYLCMVTPMVLLVIAACAEKKVTEVEEPVASVQVNPSTATLRPGETIAATARVVDAQGRVLQRTVTWQSSNPAVANISGTGTSVVITAEAEGQATITAVAEGRSGTASVMVRIIVGSVTVEPGDGKVIIGQNLQLEAVVRDDRGQPVERQASWSSSNPSIATVNAATGLVHGVGPGTVTITATVQNIQGSAEIRSLGPPLVALRPTINPTPGGARVQGQANGNGGDYEVWFEMSSTTSFTNPIRVSGRGSNLSASGDCRLVTFTCNWFWDVSILYGSRTYYHRIVAENEAGRSESPAQPFTTGAAAAPTVVTDSARPISPDTAWVYGTIVPNGADATSASEISMSSTMLTYFSCCSVLHSADDPQDLSRSSFWFNMPAGSTWYYRFRATNNVGQTVSSIKSFTTPTSGANSGVNANGDVRPGPGQVVLILTPVRQNPIMWSSGR